MEYIFEGKISVKALLKAKNREIVKLLIDEKKKDRDISYIKKIASLENIKIELKPKEEISALCTGKTHGGVVAIAKDRKYQCIEDFIDKENIFLAFVEGIEDPFNFGYVIRNLYAAGVDGIIVNERNWTNAASTLAKSSAGASELIPMFISSDYEETFQKLKQHDIKIVCAQRDDESIEMYDYDYTQSICICIGGEKRGLSKVILEHSDQNVYIPYRSDFRNALSASSASTILAYEVVRQRKSNGN